MKNTISCTTISRALLKAVYAPYAKIFTDDHTRPFVIDNETVKYGVGKKDTIDVNLLAFKYCKRWLAENHLSISSVLHGDDKIIYGSAYITNDDDTVVDVNDLNEWGAIIRCCEHVIAHKWIK